MSLSTRPPAVHIPPTPSVVPLGSSCHVLDRDAHAPGRHGSHPCALFPSDPDVPLGCKTTPQAEYTQAGSRDELCQPGPARSLFRPHLPDTQAENPPSKHTGLGHVHPKVP